MKEDTPRIVVVGGPTASGKSGVSVRLARHFQGEIVNADSMQVYRHMDVGTAKVTQEEKQGIPHHLMDVVNPDERFDAAAYRRLALPLLKKLAGEGKTGFVTGGTGLYIKTLLGGLLECPSPDPVFREKLQREWEVEGPEALHMRLASLDPESAERIHPRDRVRVFRALEVYHGAGRPLSELVREHRFREKALDALKICLQMDRTELYLKIEQRTRDMVQKGLVEETRALLDRGYSPELKPMKAIGYRHAVQHLQGRWDLEETIKEIQKDTRRYAKRQLTWFRADPEMIWIQPHDLDTMKERIETHLAKP